MRGRFEASLAKALAADPNYTKPSDDPAGAMTRAVMFFSDSPGIFMSYWYGGLYVVIEGWLELGLHDATIDQLLSSPNVGLLKRYRNGVFHFQKEFVDARFHEFFASEDSVTWVRALSSAFGDYFLSESAKRGIPEALKYFNPDGSKKS